MNNNHLLVKTLIDAMRSYYGNRYDKQWACIKPEQMHDSWTFGISGLTESEIKNGLKRMSREPWPPSVPEFRLWCQPIEPSAAFLSENVAWAYIQNAKSESNSFETFDEMQTAWGIGSAALPDRYAARKAFCDAYNRLVAVAKSEGRDPKWWMSYGHESPEQRAIAAQAGIDTGRLSYGFRSDVIQMIESTEPVDSDVQKHLAELRSILNRPKPIESTNSSISKNQSTHKTTQLQEDSIAANIKCSEPNAD